MSYRDSIHVADVSSRQRLRSSTSDDLIVPAVRLTSIDSRAFPVAGARIWNTLPLHVTSASSLTAFKQHLKLQLFFSFPGTFSSDFSVVFAVSVTRARAFSNRRRVIALNFCRWRRLVTETRKHMIKTL